MKKRVNKMSENRNEKFVLWFEEVGISDVPLVGGKNASLGEMIQNLEAKGVKVPGGFAITAYAYQYLLKHAGVENAIRDGICKRDKVVKFFIRSVFSSRSY